MNFRSLQSPSNRWLTLRSAAWARGCARPFGSCPVFCAWPAAHIPEREREIRIMRIIIAEFINISWVWQVLPWSDSFSRVSTGRQRKVSIQCQPTVDLYWQRQTRMLLSLNLASVSHTAHKSITSKPRQFARNIREKNKSLKCFHIVSINVPKLATTWHWHI